MADTAENADTAEVADAAEAAGEEAVGADDPEEEEPVGYRMVGGKFTLPRVAQVMFIPPGVTKAKWIEAQKLAVRTRVCACMTARCECT